MIILWSLLVTGAASAHKVVDSVEDIGPEAFANVTTLYPVANQSSHNNTEIISKNNTENDKINTIDNDHTEKGKTIKGAGSWKIEAAYAESNLDKDSATTAPPEVEQKNETKEFRPSQHLESYIDNLAPTKETYDSFTPMKKPASGFVSSKEVYHNTFPKELLHTHKEYPYKFESSIYTRAKDSWRPDRHKPWPTASTGLEESYQQGKWGTETSIDSLERPGKIQGSGFEGYGDTPGKVWGSTGYDFGDRPKGWTEGLKPKPTVETVKLPAGGLYKYTDPFKEKPENDGKDFGLEFNDDLKETAIKKRENPWEGVLRMLTAFIPVGLIISALTPTLITIENTDNSYPSNVFRRADASSSLPAISERCRRRLLCELHNEKNYSKAESSPRKWKQCHRIRCEDPAALEKTLKWLLERQTYRQHHHL